MTYHWKTIFGTIQGTHHIREKKYCEDWTRKSIHNGKIFVTMSDGASLASASFHGARIACLDAKDWLIQNSDTIFRLSTDNAISFLRQGTLNTIVDGIKQQKLLFPRSDIMDFSATLIFFISDGNRYYAGNLGDGLVGTMLPQGEMKILLNQDNNIWKNHTWHVTSPEAMDHLHIVSGMVEKGQRFFMMTDGTFDCVYDQYEQKFSSILSTFCSWLDYDLDERIISKALEKRMSEVFPLRTNDDCALSIFQYR